MERLQELLELPQAIVFQGLWAYDPHSTAAVVQDPDVPPEMGYGDQLPPEQRRWVWVFNSPFSYAASPQAKDLFMGKRVESTTDHEQCKYAALCPNELNRIMNIS